MTVYTPATLAKKWECSERHVRNLITSGQLPSFRLGGKLLRIRGEEVEKFECQNGESQDLEENIVSPGKTRLESGAVIDLAQTTRKRRTAAPRLDMRS